MLQEGALTFREFAMNEPLPLATVHDAVMEFLQGRDDAALYGAQAVNAYVDQPRMTQDVDLLSTRAAALAEEIREFLAGRFPIAIRVRTVAGGAAYRLYQLRGKKGSGAFSAQHPPGRSEGKKGSGAFSAQHPPGRSGKRLLTPFSPKNRHLVDIRHVAELPPCNRFEQILVLAAPELIAHKVVSMTSRWKTPKGLIDGADLRRLLLCFPELRAEEGPVREILQAMGAPERALDAWRQLLREDIAPDDDEEGY